jgi:hypothetical protein
MDKLRELLPVIAPVLLVPILVSALKSIVAALPKGVLPIVATAIGVGIALLTGDTSNVQNIVGGAITGLAGVGAYEVGMKHVPGMKKAK